MSTPSFIVSSPSSTKAKSTQTVVLVWAAGLLAVAVILALVAGGHLDPALFAISPDSGALLLP